MDRSRSQWSIREGDDVYGADVGKVGSVVTVEPGYVVVEKGFFFPTDFYVPTSAVANYEDGQVYLSVTKDEALNQGWDAEPTGGYATDTYEIAGTTDAAYGSDVSRTDAGMGVAAAGPTAMETTRVSGDETITVPVHEEELTATTRQREIGEVEIQKRVVAEERVLEVPVTEERVRVQRRAVDRPLGATDATAFEEGTIEVPIRGEEVELQKTVRVAEEVEVGKEAVQRTEQVAGTVRREEVRVTENVIEGGRTTGTTTGTTMRGTGRKRKRSS